MGVRHRTQVLCSWPRSAGGVVLLIALLVSTGVNASVVLNVLSAGTLPTPISAGSTFFSPDGGLYMAVFLSNVTAYSTTTGAVVWMALAEGSICPTLSSSSSLGWDSSGTGNGVELEPWCKQPDTTQSSVALYCGCGPSVTAVTYSGEVSTIYTSTQPSAVAVALTILAPPGHGPTVVVAFAVSYTIVAINATTKTLLWIAPVAPWGETVTATVNLHSAVDTQRNASIVGLVIRGFEHQNISGFDALTGDVKGFFSFTWIELGCNPVFGATIVAWEAAFNESQSYIFYDFVTQQQWTYYTVFPTEILTGTGTNAFILGSLEQLVLYDAVSRQVRWTHFDVKLFMTLGYDAEHDTITLWNPQSFVVSLVNATDGTLMLQSSYVDAVCGSPLGDEATGGVWLRGTHTGNVIGLTCNATTGLGLIAARGGDVSVAASAAQLLQLTPQLTAGGAPSLSSPIASSCGGPDCRYTTATVFVTFAGVVTFAYRVTIDDGIETTSPTSVTVVPAPTEHRTTPSTGVRFCRRP